METLTKKQIELRSKAGMPYWSDDVIFNAMGVKVVKHAFHIKKDEKWCNTFYCVVKEGKHVMYMTDTWDCDGPVMAEAIKWVYDNYLERIKDWGNKIQRD